MFIDSIEIYHLRFSCLSRQAWKTAFRQIMASFLTHFYFTWYNYLSKLMDSFFFTWCHSPYWTRASSLSRLHISLSLKHTHTHTHTHCRTPVDEWSALYRDTYLTTHNRQTSMPPAGIEPTIQASERPQNHALDRAATGIGFKWLDRFIVRCLCLGNLATGFQIRWSWDVE